MLCWATCMDSLTFFPRILNSVSSSSIVMATEESHQGIPDPVLAVIVQFILGIALATSAVPSTVLSLQDRGSETMGVFLLIILTASVAYPLRARFGLQDITSSEYILAVLAPIVTRVDLGLLIWVNINKALLWVEQMLYARTEELECVKLILLASRIWHNGDDRIFDPEFGFFGGEAGVVMYRLQKDYDPRNAGANFLAWIGHITLYPFAVCFHYLLQVVMKFGYSVFWVLSRIAWFFGRRKALTSFHLRGNFIDFLFRKKSAQHQKLFMRREVAVVFDSNQQIIKASRNQVRHRWAMLGSVDAIIKHAHFKKLFSIAYPMRAPVVYQRALSDPINRDILAILNKESMLFSDYSDNPLSTVGEEASRQVILYRILGWPPHSEYSKTCLDKLTKFADENMQAWSDTEARLQKKNSALSEFHAVRNILRRYLVQLVMLAWFDGLGECALDNSISSITDDLWKNYLKSNLSGVEMAVRLCNLTSEWNDEQQSSNMIKDLEGISKTCMCNVCIEVSTSRRLTTDRYLSRPSADQLEQILRQSGCLRADEIVAIWKKAVRKWISKIFETGPYP